MEAALIAIAANTAKIAEAAVKNAEAAEKTNVILNNNFHAIAEVSEKMDRLLDAIGEGGTEDLDPEDSLRGMLGMVSAWTCRTADALERAQAMAARRRATRGVPRNGR